MKIKNLIKYLSENIILRYMMWEAFATMMAYSEVVETSSSKIKIDKTFIMIDPVIMTVISSFMAFSKRFKTISGIIGAVYLLERNVGEYYFGIHNKNLSYHVFLRMSGCIASHLIVASGVATDKSKKKSKCFKLGSLIYLLLMVSEGYLLWNSKFERSLFMKYLPYQIKKQNLAPTLVNTIVFGIILLAIVGIQQKCKLKAYSNFMIAFWAALLLPIDLVYLNLPQIWLQRRIIAADICSIAGLFLLKFS